MVEQPEAQTVASPQHNLTSAEGAEVGLLHHQQVVLAEPLQF